MLNLVGGMHSLGTLVYAGVPLDPDPMTLYYYKIGCKSLGVGDKNPQKGGKFMGRLQLPDRT